MQSWVATLKDQEWDALINGSLTDTPYTHIQDFFVETTNREVLGHYWNMAASDEAQKHLMSRWHKLLKIIEIIVCIFIHPLIVLF